MPGEATVAGDLARRVRRTVGRRRRGVEQDEPLGDPDRVGAIVVVLELALVAAVARLVVAVVALLADLAHAVAADRPRISTLGLELEIEGAGTLDEQKDRAAL